MLKWSQHLNLGMLECYQRLNLTILRWFEHLSLGKVHGVQVLDQDLPVLMTVLYLPQCLANKVLCYSKLEVNRFHYGLTYIPQLVARFTMIFFQHD